MGTAAAAAAAASGSSSSSRPLLPAARRPTDGDVSSSSPETMAAFTPESTDDGGGEEEEDGGLPADPLLLRAAGQHSGGEVYELREGVGRGRKPVGLEMGEALYYDDDDGSGDDDDFLGFEEYEEEFVYTVDEEKAVVRKFDRRLVLFVALLYLLSFLDRSSESYAPTFHYQIFLLRLLSLLLALLSR